MRIVAESAGELESRAMHRHGSERRSPLGFRFVEPIRKDVVQLVERHLDEILDRLLEAMSSRVPAVAAAPTETRERVRSNARLAILAFIGLYADPDAPARLMLSEARRATVERSGEPFGSGEIVTMLHVGRDVVLKEARAYLREELGEQPALEADLERALDVFVNELERGEQSASPLGDSLNELLLAAESEGPDLS
jgi:hypothetical protein